MGRYFIFLLPIVVLSLDVNSCQNCHKQIYNEFKSSLHAHSANDKLFTTLYKKYLRKSKLDNCKECHKPNGYNSVNCLACHKIKDIKKGEFFNKNIYEKNEKLIYSANIKKKDKIVKYHTTSGFLGLFKKTQGSPYHDIDYRNKIYYDAKVCMGCHFKNVNKKGFRVCKVELKSSKDNCLKCHMSKIGGSVNSLYKNKTHLAHKFYGINDFKELSKYVKIDFKKIDGGFKISVKNLAPHPLFTHPLREAILKVSVISNNKEINLKEQRFIKILGNNNKPSMPWDATQVLKDSMLKENERRDFIYKTDLNKNDLVKVVLGFYKINLNAAKKLKVTDSNLLRFNILKELYFKIK